MASAASRKVAVSMPWSGPMATSAKEILCVSNQVLPGGIAAMLVYP